MCNSFFFVTWLYFFPQFSFSYPRNQNINRSFKVKTDKSSKKLYHLILHITNFWEILPSKVVVKSLSLPYKKLG